mmetsp:Transcript_22105/g.34805  ORF Transcript_22105/g.34805 Transcript_22105/m.34805 type:complete len:350 (-) Transcript_22105:1044-2093(-)
MASHLRSRASSYEKNGHNIEQGEVDIMESTKKLIGGSNNVSQKKVKEHTALERLGAALFYGITSLLVIFVNKAVLTNFAFPSSNALALGQFLVTVFVLAVLKRLGMVHYSDFSWSLIFRVLPVSVLFLLNVASGLGGTGRVSLPMFTALRRFSILFLLLLERWVLGMRASRLIHLSVAMMIGGALIAACRDLAFDLHGYVLIFANDVFTALYGVTMKKRLSTGVKMSKMDLLFYNSLISSVGMGLLLSLALPEELARALAHEGLRRPSYATALLLLAMGLGSVLNYAIFVCTSVNSALTTAVVGCLKNVATTFLGMLLGDYIFAWVNFIGINISLFGSLVYSYGKFTED